MVWDFETGKVVRSQFGCSGFNYSIVVTPDSKYIIASGSPPEMSVYNLNAGNLKKTLSGHKKDVISVVVSADGQHIVSGSED